MLRIVFFGNEIRILDELMCLPVEVIGVYLPDGPYWLLNFRKLIPAKIMWRWFKTVSVHARLFNFMKQQHIAELRGADVNDHEFIQQVKRLNPDIGIVANFGRIICSQMLKVTKFGFINYHPSLLPKYRGPNPFERIFLNGERKSGISWHQMTEQADQGDILAQKEFFIYASDTIENLDKKSMQLAKSTIGGLLKNIEEGRVIPKPQNEEEATCFPKLSKSEKKRLKELLNR